MTAILMSYNLYTWLVYANGRNNPLDFVFEARYFHSGYGLMYLSELHIPLFKRCFE
jgi:hypothetical protein